MPEMRRQTLSRQVYGQKFLATKEKDRYNQEQHNCKLNLK